MKRVIRKKLIEFRKQQRSSSSSSHLTQIEFATLCGIDSAQLSNYEQNRHEPLAYIWLRMQDCAKEHGIDLQDSLIEESIKFEVLSVKKTEDKERVLITSLKEARELLGKTQIEMAKECQVHHRAWGRYERGESDMGILTWLRIRNTFQHYGIELGEEICRRASMIAVR